MYNSQKRIELPKFLEIAVIFRKILISNPQSLATFLSIIKITVFDYNDPSMDDFHLKITYKT